MIFVNKRPLINNLALTKEKWLLNYLAGWLNRMKALVQILKTLADKNRLRIIGLLADKRMCVCELAFVLKISPPAISRHLKKMKAAGLVESEQEGYWTNYFLIRNSKMQSILREIDRWLKEDKDILADKERAQKADRKKLCCR